MKRIYLTGTLVLFILVILCSGCGGGNNNKTNNSYTMHYDLVNSEGISWGSAGTYEAATRLFIYTTGNISKIRIFLNELPTLNKITVTMYQTIYSSGLCMTGNQLCSQDVTVNQSGWQEITLNNPVPVNAGDIVWVGYQATVGATSKVFGADTNFSHNEGDLYRTYTGSWNSWTHYKSKGIATWNIQAIIEVPSLASSYTLHYDLDNNDGASYIDGNNTSGTAEAATHFFAYTGGTISKVKIYINNLPLSSNKITLILYGGWNHNYSALGAPIPGVLLRSQDIVITTTGWHEISLLNPLTVNTGDDFFIGYQASCDGTTHQVFGADTSFSHPEGCWYRYYDVNSSSWGDWCVFNSFTWNIQATLNLP